MVISTAGFAFMLELQLHFHILTNRWHQECLENIYKFNTFFWLQIRFQVISSQTNS